MESTRAVSRQQLKPMSRTASRQMSRQSVRSMGSEVAASMLRDIAGEDTADEEAERMLQRMAAEDDDESPGLADDSLDEEERAARDRAALAELAAAVGPTSTRTSTTATTTVFGGTEDAIAESAAYAGTDIVALAPEVVVHAAGNGLRVFSPLKSPSSSSSSSTSTTLTVCHMWGLGRAVGAIAASRYSGRIAYAERGLHPVVRVVEYPGFRLIAALRGAAEIEVASLAFSHDGSLLATLGGLPDFTLAVWDVITETMIVSLESAAAPCTQVGFDPTDCSLLCTSGAGRAAFWRVETRDSHRNLVRVDMVARATNVTRPMTTESIAEWHAQELREAVADDIPFVCHTFIPGHRVVCGDAVGSIHVFDATLGSREAALSWAVPGMDGVAVTAIAATRTGLILGTADGRVLWTNPESRMVLASMKVAGVNGSSVASLAVVGQLAIAGSKCGRLASMMIALPETEPISMNVLGEGHAGSIAAISVLPALKALCSCGSDGMLRMFNIATMQLLYPPVDMHGPQTALSCGQRTAVLAVGSATGVIRVFSCKPQPMLVYRERVFSKPIIHIAFHPFQLFLAIASEGGRLCLLDAMSPTMRPVGFIDFGAEITDIVWHVADVQHQLFLTLVGGSVHRLVVPMNRHVGDGTPPAGPMLRFSDLQASAMRIRWTATAIAIDTSSSNQSKQLFWTLTDDRGMRRFLMPDRGLDPESLDEGDATQPREETIGCHEKIARCLRLSPDGMWLASAGNDGSVQLRRAAAQLRRADVSHAGHDPATGIASICFTPDSRFLFSAGGRAIIRWAIPGTSTTTESIPATEVTSAEEPFRGFTLSAMQDVVDNADEKALLDKLVGIVGSSMSEAAPKAAVLRSALVDVRAALAGIVEQNEHGCDDERLTEEEMLVNVEERNRLQQEGAAQVAALRERIREENLARDLIAERLRREFWESMEDHACVVRGFRNKIEVANFPLLKRSQSELLLENRIVALRRTELVELRRSGLISSPTPTSYFTGSIRLMIARQQQQQQQQRQVMSTAEQEDAAAEAATAIPGQQLREKELRELLYHPFDLSTPLRKRTQMHLLRMVVRDIRKQFNEELARFLDAKRAAISHIEDRNAHIRELCDELREKPDTWQPALDDAERPESVFEIHDSEISAKKPTQGKSATQDKARGVEGGTAEQESAERGLRAMMGGKLGDRSGPSLLDVDEAAEAAADQKPEWYGQREPETEDEKKAVKEYEKRAQARKDERQKHRRALETELKKTIGQVDEAVTAFDERLKQLLAQKMLADMAVCQEQLLIVRLAATLLVQEGNAAIESQLIAQIETLRRKKARTMAAVVEARARHEMAKNEFEARLQTDRIAEKSFRRDFERAEREDTFPLLLKAFRNRKKPDKHKQHRHRHRHPRSRQGKQTTEDDSDAFAGVVDMDAEQSLETLQSSEGLVDVEEESLASPPEKPAEIDEVAWGRLLEVRAEKIKAEIAVKRAAVELESAKRALQQAQQRSERLKQELDEAIATEAEFAKKQRWDALNLEMLFRLKQGQVEVEEAPVVTRLDGSVVIDSHRVEELNAHIRSLSKEKAELLQQIAAAKKIISKKRWENTGIDMQVQDIQEKTKFLQLMRVTKQLQVFLKSGGEDTQATELASLERRAEHEKKAFEMKMEELRRKQAKIDADTKAKERDSERLTRELAAMRTAVAERSKIHQVQQVGAQHTVAAGRLDKLHQRERLEATIRAQNREIQQLRAQLDAVRQQFF